MSEDGDVVWPSTELVVTKDLLQGLVDKEFITKEQLKKIEKYIIENQKPEKEKSSQKRAPDEVSHEDVLVTTKKRVENKKGPLDVKPILPDENMKIVDQLLNTEEEDIDSPSTIEIVPYESLSRPDNNSICLFSVISHLLKSSKKSAERSWKADEIFMRNCRELAKFDSVLLLPILSSLFEKLCYLCNSLRSLVVREAIMTVEELFLSLKNVCLTPGREAIGAIALKSTSDKQFLREECLRCLDSVFLAYGVTVDRE